MTTTTMTKADFLASKPSWAKSAIYAAYEVDKSDIYTDYFATHTERIVFLGWSSHTKDLFAEMRKAAARFPDTAHLAAANKAYEHREKYSMGKGYYLKAGGSYSSGWKVRKAGDWYLTATVEMLAKNSVDNAA